MTQPTSPSPEVLPLTAPFVVSVTGHRDLVEEEALRESFGIQLKELRTREKLQTQDCLLLSALAEGADTLAAQVALNMGWRVIAPLPLRVEEYRRDFEGQARAEFDELLGKCGHFFVGYAPGCDKHNTREHGEFRERQYAFVGEFLTRHCEVLIAFWDGHEADGVGGTGDVVQMQREGIRGGLLELQRDGALLDEPEGGSVIVIWSQRKKHRASGKTIKDWKQHGEAEPLKAETNGQRPGHSEARRKAWTHFVVAANQVEALNSSEELPEAWDEEPPYLSQVRDAFLRADQLASRFQSEVNARFNAVVAAGSLFTVFIAAAGAWSDQKWSLAPLVVSWGFLLLAWWVVRQEKSGTNGRRANRHQDYRALAEAWRVAYFWRSVGIPEALDRCYLRSQRGELDWIRQALRVSDLEWRAEQAKSTNSPEGFAPVTPNGFEQAADRWIGEQIKYFKGKVPQDREYLTSLRNWSWALVILGLCASAADTPARMNLEGTLGWSAWLGRFVTTFADANMLTSPFVPAVLSLVHMSSWPIATEENTKNPVATTKPGAAARKQLRDWFVRQSAERTFVAVAGGLLMLGVMAGFYVGLLPSTQRVPLLQMIATVAFFLPAIIFAHAEFKALPEHVRLYERMSRIFASAQKLVQEVVAAKDSEAKPGHLQPNWNDDGVKARLKRIYRELGREALHENGEWLLIHRERPLDIEA